MPFLAPANAQEVLDYGLHGIALSRYSSTLVGLKLVTDVVEGGGSVYVSPDSPKINVPERAGARPGITVYTESMAAERQLWDVKLRLVLDYARANDLNQISGDTDASIGIVAAGKAWQDLEHALAGMGYANGRLGGAKVRLLKVGMVWPLDQEIVTDFAEGLDTIIVVEEKRKLIEVQIKEAIFDDRRGRRVWGGRKGSPEAEVLFPVPMSLDPELARAAAVGVTFRSGVDIKALESDGRRITVAAVVVVDARRRIAWLRKERGRF